MKLPRFYRNWISVLGAYIAIMNLIFIAFLIILTSFFDFGSAYVGLVIYIVLPGFLVGGLLMIPLGIYITRKKLKGVEPKKGIKEWPIINFNNTGTRNATLIFIVGTFVLVIFSSVGSYQAYHYTESVEFCGKLCHRVMKPEYVAYHQSAHERVACVECHVGNGASWYVKSKLSGLYQVYAVLTNVYPRPIPTPVENLRPARETCEECHWPEKFYDRKVRNKRSYLADDTNTEWNINLTMKTSASHSSMGNAEGIHWHINPDVKIEYISNDKKRGVIPWVKYTNLKTGETKIFKDQENPIEQSKLDSLETRTMDCLDCHNRPSHNYLAPQVFIDQKMVNNEIPKDLPEIKLMGVSLFSEDYPTTDSAFSAIKSQITEYYESSYPELFKSRKADIDKAIAGLQDGYSKNFFPEMKVKWSEYPNHLGHKISNGCYRCHDEKHSTSDGEIISRECTLCHNITAQGPTGNMEYSAQDTALEFHHPVDIDKAWQEMLCAECHSALY